MPLAYQKERWSTRRHPPWDSESRRAVEAWVAVTVAGAVTEAVAVVGAGGPAPGGRGRGAVSGMGQTPPDKVPIPGIAAALRGLDSKPKQRISRRQLVRNRQHLDIA
jgi:hypothetical protein